MLYQELKRVNDIDTAIADLHKHLADLYKERASLLNSDGTPVAIKSRPTIKLPKTSPDDLINTYYLLHSAWEELGVKLPKLKSIEPKLEQALNLKLQLIAEAPHLHDALSIVAVPPTRTLRKIIDKSQRFALSQEILEQTPKNSAWQFVVAISPDLSIPIYGLTTFIEGEEYLYQGHDGRGMGVYELIAAELQGVSMTSANSWSVLLKNQLTDGGWVCAFPDNQQIVFELEDTNCLLGENYLRLMFHA